MKQKDIAVILVVIAVSGIFSFIISGQLFTSPKNRQQKVEVVDSINSTFATPDSTFFNRDSINPTQLITIGNGSNPNPFNSQTPQ